MSTVRTAVLTAALLAAAAAPLTLAGPASAAPASGSCNSGTIAFDSSPIGLSPSPTTAAFHGNLNGCDAAAPAPTGTFSGDFTGNGNCFDVTGQIDGAIAWSNGEVTKVSGPWEVPGGLGAPHTNSVAITSGPGAGGQLVVAQGPINGAAATPDCLSNNVRDMNIAITSARIG